MILGMEHPWCETDTLLAMALELDERGRCPKGHHLDEKPDPDVGVEVKTVVCPECAALEDWQRQHEKGRPPAGTLTYTVRQRSQARERRRRRLEQASRPR